MAARPVVAARTRSVMEAKAKEARALALEEIKAIRTVGEELGLRDEALREYILEEKRAIAAREERELEAIKIETEKAKLEESKLARAQAKELKKQELKAARELEELKIQAKAEARNVL